MTVESEQKQINDLVAVYNAEAEKYLSGNVKASAARARKALAEIAKLSKANRKSITERVNKDKATGGSTGSAVGGKHRSVKKKS